MKAMTMVGAMILVTMVSAAALHAQRGPERSRAPMRVQQLRASSGANVGPALLRRVQVTLDRAEIIGLSTDQIAALADLRDDAAAAAESLRGEQVRAQDALRASLRAEAESRDPLPLEPQARAQVLHLRRQERQARAAEVRLRARELRAEAVAMVDPLVQRYEQIVPPSQRPQLGGAGRDALRRRDARGVRPVRGPRGQRSGRRGG